MLIVVGLQIGAIYLWSYVYNIVRVSSRATSKAVEKYHPPYVVSTSSSESPISEPVSCTEPLLSSKDLEDHAVLPSCTRQSKALVLFHLISFSKFIHDVFGIYFLIVNTVNLKKHLQPMTEAWKESIS